MRYLTFFFLSLFFISCKNEAKQPFHKDFHEVEVETILENDSLSIRAIEVIGNNLAFAANGGNYGLYISKTGKWKTNIQKQDSLAPEFRAIASTGNDFFMLSAGNPALLYKTGDDGKMQLVYQEKGKKIFYDAMAFWNDKEGLAIGDPVNHCLSIIITRDGGRNWSKLSCDKIPAAIEGEAAFAASNSNIAIVGNKAWILSGGMQSRVYFSEDKGKNWKVFNTPVIGGKTTTGGYSIDFYDNQNGIIIGGDYTHPEANKANKAITTDGGKTWKLVASNKYPGYKSAIRYVPNSGAKKIVAVGFTGISYSDDGGENWEKISNEGFFTLRFVNDSTAFAAGKGRISKLNFK